MKLLKKLVTLKTKINLGLFSVLLFSLLIFSCKKQVSESQKPEAGFVEINFSLSNLKSVKATFSDTATTSTLKYVVISVEDFTGKYVKSSEKVELFNMNGNYISKPLSIQKGDYKLTSFFVLDGNDNVVYISPLKGSSKAYLVYNPLPLNFSVQTNMVTKINPEVLNASGNKPEDFGYATFNFNIAQTFDFLLGTFIYDDLIKNYKLTSSAITILTDSVTTYLGSLNVPSGILVSKYDSLGITNKISLPEQFNKYTLIISKSGYKTFKKTFTKEELKLHFRSADKGPLVVFLEKGIMDGLVAYYKFNGDVLDYSGFNNNGILYGPSVTADRKGNNNSAFQFDGINDDIVIENSPSLNPRDQISVCAWIKPFDFVGSGNDVIVDKPYTSHIQPHYQYHLAVDGNYPGYSYSFGFNICLNNVNNGVNSRTIWTPNNWYFVVGTYDGSSLKIYVNGSLIRSETASGTISAFDTNICIGGSRNTFYHTPCVIDEVRIYSRALSDTEIMNLYQE